MAALARESDIGMIYLPASPEVRLDLTQFSGSGKVVGIWADPRTGKRSPAGKWDKTADVRVKTPGSNDWILLLKNE